MMKNRYNVTTHEIPYILDHNRACSPSYSLTGATGRGLSGRVSPLGKLPRRRLRDAPRKGPPQGVNVYLQPVSQVGKFGFGFLGSAAPLQRYRQ